MRTTFLRVVVCAALPLWGCANTEIASDIPPELVARTAVLTQPYALSPLIVSVRWPAVIDPSTSDELKKAWQRFGEMENDEAFSVGVLSANNTYHAAQTYVALRKAMPEAHIVLEPQLLTKDKSGGLASAPIVDGSLPVALVIDLANFDTARFPFLVERISFVLRSPSALSPANCGLHVAAQNQFPALMGRCSPTSYSVANTPPLWYTGAYSKNSEQPGVISKLPLDGRHTLVYPHIGLANTSMMGAVRPSYVTNGAPATIEDIYKMELNPLVVNIAALTSGAPSIIRTADVSDRMMEQYIRKFDPALADAVREGAPLNLRQKTNVQLVSKLLITELQARTKRDATTTGWVLAGEFGTSFRTAREQSYSGWNKTMITSWITALAITSAGAATGAFNSKDPAYFSNQASMLMLSMAIIDSSIKDFNTSFIPTAQALEKATLDFEGSKVSVNLFDQQALTRALKDIYARYKQGPAR